LPLIDVWGRMLAVEAALVTLLDRPALELTQPQLGEVPMRAV
jgi:hypothetical protein